MDILERRSDLDLYRTILAESAKALNELNCAKTDIDKAMSREKFIIAVVNVLIERQKGVS